MKRVRLVLLLVLLALVAGHAVSDRRTRIPLKEPLEVGAGVRVAREGELFIVRVPRRTGVRLRAVLADAKKQRLLPLEEIAKDALAGVNGDYHWLDGKDFARTYSLLVTDGAVAWSASASESFWLDEKGEPHVGMPAAGARLAIGTGPRLLEGGSITERVRTEKTQEGWTASLARTAVGFDDATVFLVVTAQEPHAGLSMEALALAMKRLGCKEALNLDGAPSSTLVAKGQLVNVPPGEEGRVNPVASALLVLAPDGSPGLR